MKKTMTNEDTWKSFIVLKYALSENDPDYVYDLGK